MKIDLLEREEVLWDFFTSFSNSCYFIKLRHVTVTFALFINYGYIYLYIKLSDASKDFFSQKRNKISNY